MTRLPTEPRERLVGFFQAIGDTMLVVINWVLWIAPVGVFALAFVVGARAGGSAFGALLHYVLIVSAVGIVVWLAAWPLAFFGARISPLRFTRAIAPSQAVAISTQSSLACLPAMLRATAKLDVPVAASGVVLPMAVAIFRATGPAMNFAVPIYIAYWYGIPLTTMMLAMGLAAAATTTMGAAGIPGPGHLHHLDRADLPRHGPADRAARLADRGRGDSGPVPHPWQRLDGRRRDRDGGARARGFESDEADTAEDRLLEEGA